MHTPGSERCYLPPPRCTRRARSSSSSGGRCHRPAARSRDPRARLHRRAGACANFSRPAAFAISLPTITSRPRASPNSTRCQLRQNWLRPAHCVGWLPLIGSRRSAPPAPACCGAAARATGPRDVPCGGAGRQLRRVAPWAICAAKSLADSAASSRLGSRTVVRNPGAMPGRGGSSTNKAPEQINDHVLGADGRKKKRQHFPKVRHPGPRSMRPAACAHRVLVAALGG